MIKKALVPAVFLIGLLTVPYYLFGCAKVAEMETTTTTTTSTTTTATPGSTTTTLYGSAGVTWAQTKGGFPDYETRTSLSFDNKLFVVAGYLNDPFTDREKEVWWSDDNGLTWTLATGEADFGSRYYHAVATFEGKMWLLAGFDPTYNPVTDPFNGRRNSVWYSSDGNAWTQAVASAEFSPRDYPTAVAFDGKLWLIGGHDGSGNYFNDVWWSDDGVTWEAATTSAGFSGRSKHTSVVYDGKIWVIGGYGSGGIQRDVWYSADGISWHAATTEAGCGYRQDHASVVFDDRIWVVAGGTSGVNYTRDVWFSFDGSNWIEATSEAQFSARSGQGLVVHNNKMRLIGGTGGGVWYSPVP